MHWLESQFKAGFRFAQAHPRLARLGLTFRDPNPKAGSLASRIKDNGLATMEMWVAEAQHFGEIRDDLDARLLASLILSAQTSIFDILCSMTNTSSPDELFAKKRLATMSEEELDAVVHGVMSVFGHGVSTNSEPTPHEGAQHSPFDIDAMLENIFTEP